MKALSIRQPWANLILRAGKDIENRTWPTSFRGRIYVHAGKSVDWDVDHMDTRGHRFEVKVPEETGAILGEVDIVDCVTESDSKWFDGPYGFVLENAVAYGTPIPYKGQLGLFDVVLP